MNKLITKSDLETELLEINNNYIKIPKILFTDKTLKKLSSESKILYCYIVDKADGKNYIGYELEELAEILECSKTKITRYLKELNRKNLVGYTAKIIYLKINYYSILNFD